jgi:hypothetical protein
MKSAAAVSNPIISFPEFLRHAFLSWRRIEGPTNNKKEIIVPASGGGAEKKRYFIQRTHTLSLCVPPSPHLLNGTDRVFRNPRFLRIYDS